MTWMTIVVSTSFVLWIGELVRLIRRFNTEIVNEKKRNQEPYY